MGSSSFSPSKIMHVAIGGPWAHRPRHPSRMDHAEDWRESQSSFRSMQGQLRLLEDGLESGLQVHLGLFLVSTESSHTVSHTVP